MKQIDQFRGLTLHSLTLLIEAAAARGGVTLMKHVNVRANCGKAPALVLAEQLIAVVHDPEVSYDN